MGNRDDLLWAKGLIDEAYGQNFFGQLTIVFNSGQAVHAYRNESLTPHKNGNYDKKDLTFSQVSVKK